MQLDPKWFRPDLIPPEVDEFNAWVASESAGKSTAMDVGPERARTAREAGVSIFGALDVSPGASDEEVAGPDGPVAIHLLEPEGEPTGVYLHIHGGGWVLGAAHHHDRVNARLVEDAGVVVVSVEYRLAPEHPHPAGLADCLAVARWLVDSAPMRWRTGRLLIGGESAGAHLAALTMLAMPRDAFSKALLSYGVYDVRNTPSVRQWGERDLILSRPLIDWFAALTYPPDLDLSDPSVSPMLADLSGLPPARFSVGTLDPLLDDTLFMASRWAAAGNRARMDVYPGAIHAFDYFPGHPYATRAWAASAAWLAEG